MSAPIRGVGRLLIQQAEFKRGRVSHRVPTFLERDGTQTLRLDVDRRAVSL